MITADRNESTVRVRVGAWLWILQLATLAAELTTVAAVQAPYDLARNTISDLGVASCTTVAHPLGPVAVCSPLHTVLNASLVLAGLATGSGAVLLWQRPRSCSRSHACC
jgi:hypothetical membrane protein